MRQTEAATIRAGAAAVLRYGRQIAEADRLADEAQLHGVPAQYVWFVAARLTLPDVVLLLNRARAAELLDPEVAA